jgi:hypothetical protein
MPRRLDKFDIIQHANDAVEEVRRAEFFRKGRKMRDVIKKTESPKKPLTAKSGCESPLNSPTTTANGRSPTGMSFRKKATCPSKGWHPRNKAK